jgi:tRNA threonylcarbamoyl adenosine modification protein YjeE
MKFTTKSEQETIEVAKDLVQKLNSCELIFLHGNLGSGKTVFARALIRALTGDKKLEVPSPTFTLLQTYESVHGLISHYDLYRLKEPDGIFELDWEEALSSGVTIVEWPERLGELMPPVRLDIRLANVKNKPDARDIEISRVE